MPSPAAAPVPPRRPRAALVLAAAALAGALLSGGALALARHLGATEERHRAPTTRPPPAAPTPAVAHARYACPMHPDVTSDHPGVCPACGMRLVEDATADLHGSDADRSSRP